MKVFDIEKDGLYNKNDKSLVGRVAFIFDGCIVWKILIILSLTK